MAQSDNIRTQRLQKLAELREQGIEPFANGFAPTHTIAQILGEFGALAGPELEALEQTFRLAGRLMLLREFGKASFCHFQDGTGRVQAYVQKQVSARRPSPCSNAWTWATSSGSPARCSAPEPGSSPWR